MSGAGRQTDRCVSLPQNERGAGPQAGCGSQAPQQKKAGFSPGLWRWQTAYYFWEHCLFPSETALKFAGQFMLTKGSQKMKVKKNTHTHTLIPHNDLLTLSALCSVLVLRASLSMFQTGTASLLHGCESKPCPCCHPSAKVENAGWEGQEGLLQWCSLGVFSRGGGGGGLVQRANISVSGWRTVVAVIGPNVLH